MLATHTAVLLLLPLQVIRRLGKGAQGSVFLVEDKRDGGKFVMKKVECNDEAEAEKAFKEVNQAHGGLPQHRCFPYAPPCLLAPFSPSCSSPPPRLFFCLHQALALETLSHEYICGYRELFVNWDRDEATMFVCIVMDFYEAGRFPSEKIVRRVCVSECEFKCE